MSPHKSTGVNFSLTLCVFPIWEPPGGSEMTLLRHSYWPCFDVVSHWSQDEGCSPLRRPRCRCTSSSRGTCWPGTIGKFYTAASSSAPSSPKYRRCQCLSPTHTHTHKENWLIMACGEAQQIMGLWRILFSHLLWIWMAEGLIILTPLLLH